MKTIITITLFLSVILISQNVHAQQHHDHDSQKQQELRVGEVHPEHSLYHLDAGFTDHRGMPVKLSDFKGKPVIVVMFYGNCTEVCPILIRDSWRLYRSLSETTRQEVQVLAVSFDTENDTPEVLLEYAEYEQLNIPGWHFITGNHSDIRSLAMLLGVKYRKKSDGHYAHSNLVTVLDKEGKIANRVEGLNQSMEEAASVIERMLQNL